MRIEFEVKVNDTAIKFGPMINTAFFKLPNGEKVVIDRCTTEWRFDTEHPFMLWRDCYIWDGKKENFLKENDTRIKDAVFECFEIEDDAPADYEIEAISVSI